MSYLPAFSKCQEFLAVHSDCKQLLTHRYAAVYLTKWFMIWLCCLSRCWYIIMKGFVNKIALCNELWLMVE